MRSRKNPKPRRSKKEHEDTREWQKKGMWVERENLRENFSGSA